MSARNETSFIMSNLFKSVYDCIEQRVLFLLKLWKLIKRNYVWMGLLFGILIWSVNPTVFNLLVHPAVVLSIMASIWINESELNDSDGTILLPSLCLMPSLLRKIPVGSTPNGIGLMAGPCNVSDF